jgi:hypothetical protein
MAQTVDIEYLGDPPIMDDVTKFRIAVGEIDPEAATLLRSADTQRNQAVKGVTKRVVDPEYFGTSRRYVFDGSTMPPFVTAVDKRDVDKILGSDSSHQFRIYGHEGIEIIRPAGDFQLVGEVEGKSLNDVYR